MAKDFMSKLVALEGAVSNDYDPFSNVVRTPSPSFNSLFGKAHGLPRGYSAVVYGPQKGGKTLIANAMAGQVHKDYPDSYVIKFDTEFREQAQNTPEALKMWGIDRSRYLAFSVNSAELIFDRIESEIAAMCQDGMDVPLIILDSTSSIQGQREEEAESVTKQFIGDHAMTLQKGLRRILSVQRKYNIGLLMTAHVRAEMDQVEIMRGNKYRMQASYGLKHHTEYFILMEPNQSKEGKVDLLGNTFTNEAITDVKDNAERTGHKIKATMKDSSLGPKGRVAEFTLDYNNGIVNTYEEVFLLGTGRNVIQRPNQLSYTYKNVTWKGKANCVEALRADPDMCKEIVKEIRAQDLKNAFSSQDRLDAEANAEAIIE